MTEIVGLLVSVHCVGCTLSDPDGFFDMTHTGEEKIWSALSQCGYPKWAFTQVKDKMATKQVKRKKNKKDTTKKSKGYIHILYVEGIAKKATHIFCRHDKAMVMSPTLLSQNF